MGVHICVTFRVRGTSSKYPTYDPQIRYSSPVASSVYMDFISGKFTAAHVRKPLILAGYMDTILKFILVFVSNWNKSGSWVCLCFLSTKRPSETSYHCARRWYSDPGIFPVQPDLWSCLKHSAHHRLTMFLDRLHHSSLDKALRLYCRTKELSLCWCIMHSRSL